MARILLAIPTFESVSPDTFRSLWDMDRGGHDVAFEFVRGYDCAHARNRIGSMAVEGGFDYAFMVDADVTIPHDALVNLVSHQVGFVSGYYLHRSKESLTASRTCVCRLADSEGHPYFGYPEGSQYSPRDMQRMRDRGEHLVEIHGGGMGCALVKVEVFRKLKYPWFAWRDHNNEHKGCLSEDLYFCEQLRKAGIRRFVDTRVACGHLFRAVVEP